MGIPVWIFLGIVTGSVARLAMPGPRAGGLAVAIPLGIGGALLGGAMSRWGMLHSYDVRDFLMAMIGALAVLVAYRSSAMRGTEHMPAVARAGIPPAKELPRM